MSSDMSSVGNIAIVGAGAMATYTLKAFLLSETPLHITVFEASDLAGCGMPYRPGTNADYMYCNAFSKEIPSITQPLVAWLRDRDDAFLERWGLERSDIDARVFYPRVMLGEYLHSEFESLCGVGRAGGHTIVVMSSEIVDVVPAGGHIEVCESTDCGGQRFAFTHVVLATGHSWPNNPRIGSVDLISPWPYTNVTDLEPGRIGVLGSSLSAIDVIIALGHEHGTFVEDGENVSWFAKSGRESISITMVSHRGIMPEPDFYYVYPYESLRHVSAEAVAHELTQGRNGLLDRVFALLIAELDEADPDYVAALGDQARTIDGFAEAYFEHRERLGGLRALRESLRRSVGSIEDKETQHHRYALLRGHQSFGPILEHLDDDDWQTFSSKLLPVFSDCYAAIPHVSVRRILALYDAGVLDIIPTGPDGTFSQAGGRSVIVSTIDGDIRFDALIDARGQAAAPLADLPFPHLIAALSDPHAILVEPFQLDLDDQFQATVSCLAMPQILERHPFSQGLPNCAELGRVVARDILSRAQHDRTV
ncbi:MAG: FAD/NAD(P)-binding protein [Ilumatobacteraceae bacterium]